MRADPGTRKNRRTPLPSRRWRVTISYVGEEIYVVQAVTLRAAVALARKRFQAEKRRRSVEVEKVAAHDVRHRLLDR